MVHEPRTPAYERIEGDVLGDCHFRKERQVLPDDGDPAVTRRIGRHGGLGLAEIVHLGAGLRPIDARDDLDQRALATAIFSSETMNLAALDRE